MCIRDRSGSGYTPSSAASAPQQPSTTPSVQSTETVKSTEQPFKSSSLTDANSQKNLISDVFARLRGNGSTTPSYSGGLSGTTSVPSANLGTGAPTSTGGSSTTPADNLSKLSTGGEAASNKVLDDLLKSSVSPDEQILSETDKTLEEDLPMLTEGENNPVTDNIATEDTALTDLSTSTLDDSLPTDNGSSSDWIKYAGLGTLGLGAVGLGTAALMSKNKKLVISLLVVVVLMAIVPLFMLKNAEFGGSDDAGSEVVAEIQGGEYEPWFNPIIETILGKELPGEVESLLFCVQTGIGVGIIAFYMGRLVERKKHEDNNN